MSCLLCFQPIVNFDILEIGTPREYCERIFQSCNKHLSSEIRGSLFPSTYSPKSRIPLCLVCLEFSEKLIQIDDELQGHVELFTNKVLDSRKQFNNLQSEINVRRTTRKKLTNLEFEEDGKHNPRINKSKNLLPGPLPILVVKKEIQPPEEDIIDVGIIKVEENAFQDYFSDFGDDFAPPVSPLTNSPNCEPVNSTNVSSVNSFRELRVTLNRLSFDSTGKVLIPEAASTLGKRKAAILASAALLRKQTEDEDCPKLGTRVINTKKRIPRWELRKRVRCIISKKQESKSIPQKPKFKCAMCDSVFHHARELDSHCKITEHVTEHKFECEKCEEKFYIQWSLRNHLARVHEFKKCVCHFCGHISETIRRHKTHMATHYSKTIPVKPNYQIFKCDECEKSFFQNHPLVRHKIDAHGMESPYKCATCGQIFTRQYGLDVHMEIHKESDDIPIRTCKTCGFESKTHAEHRTHLQKHSTKKRVRKRIIAKPKEKTEKPKRKLKTASGSRFPCDVCNEKFFPRTTAVIEHKIRVHGMESPFKCAQCGKTFPKKSKMMTHFKNDKHCAGQSTNSIKYWSRRSSIVPPKPTCDFCGEVFENLTALRVHKTYVHKSKVVSTEKSKAPKGDHLCHDCGKIFTLKHSLNMHIKVIHLKEISFECSTCQKSFANKLSLTKHQKLHTGITHDCQICGKGFFEKSNLTSHFMRIHELKRPPRKSYTRTPGLPVKEALMFREDQEKRQPPQHVSERDPLAI